MPARPGRSRDRDELCRITVKQTGQIRRRGTDFELGRTSPSGVLFRLVAPHFSNRDPILGRPRGVEFVGRLRLTPRNSKFGSGPFAGNRRSVRSRVILRDS